MKKIVRCPFCGAEGKKYHNDILKIFLPIYFLDWSYQCLGCREMFNKPYVEGEQFKKPNKFIGNWKFIIFIVLVPAFAYLLVWAYFIYNL